MTTYYVESTPLTDCVRQVLKYPTAVNHQLSYPSNPKSSTLILLDDQERVVGYYPLGTWLRFSVEYEAATDEPA